MSFIEWLIDAGRIFWQGAQRASAYPVMHGAMDRYLNEGFSIYSCEPMKATLSKQGVLGGKTVSMTVLDDGSVFVKENWILGQEHLVPRHAGTPTPEEFISQSNQGNGIQTDVTLINKQLFEILGCSPNSSIEEIRLRYRSKVKDFHPDFLSSKDLPPQFIEFANEKMAEITCAYEEICRIKGETP
jgi:hypothetical protein